MPTTDERLASLEARMNRIDELFTLVGEVRKELGGLRADMNRQFSEIRTELHGEIGGLRGEMNQRLLALDGKVDRDFRTLIATQLAVLIAVVSALMGAYFR